MDLSKWGLYGADPVQVTGSSLGYYGHGQRRASQTTVGGGFLSVTGTADGKTGGLSSQMRPSRPESYDCSGLTQKACQSVGISLNRTSRTQETMAGRPAGLNSSQGSGLLRQSRTRIVSVDRFGSSKWVF